MNVKTGKEQNVWLDGFDRSPAETTLALICKFALVTSMLLFAALAKAQSSCPEDAVSFEVKWKGGHVFEVEARFSKSKGLFQIFDVSAVSSGAASDYIRNAVEVHPAGDLPLVYKGDGAWVSPNGETDQSTTIRYELYAAHDDQAWPNGKEEVAYRFDRAFYFVGSRFFLMNFGLSFCSPRVRFNLPRDWSVLAPWPEPVNSVFRPPDGQALFINGFALGPGIRSFSSSFSDSGHVTFVFENSLENIAQQASHDMRKLVLRYQKLFAGVPGSDFMIFMTSDSGNDGGAFRSSFAQRFKLPVRPTDGMVWRSAFAHETLHLWLGQSIRFSGHETEWFKEGFTDYLTAKTLFAEDIFDTEQYERKLEKLIGRYLVAAMLGDRVPLEEAGHHKNRNRLTVYGGGAVMAMLLDAEMTSNLGNGTFEAMMADLFNHRNEPFDFDRLMRELDRHSSGRASTIFSQVSEGINPFALADRLDIYGLELSVFTPEELYVRFSGQSCQSAGERCPPPCFLTFGTCP